MLNYVCAKTDLDSTKLRLIKGPISKFPGPRPLLFGYMLRTQIHTCPPLDKKPWHHWWLRVKRLRQNSTNPLDSVGVYCTTYYMSFVLMYCDLILSHFLLPLLTSAVGRSDVPAPVPFHGLVLKHRNIHVAFSVHLNMGPPPQSMYMYIHTQCSCVDTVTQSTCIEQ